MYSFLVKNGQLVAFGLGLLITVIFFASALNGDDPDRFSFGLSAAIGLAVLCAVIMVLFGLYHVAMNPKGSMKGVITFGVLLALFAVMYATADTSAVTASMAEKIEKFQVTDAASKFISGAMGTTGALVAIAIVAFIFSEVRNFFK